MNKFYFLLGTWLLIFLVGCNNEEGINPYVSSEEADAIAFEHLVLQNGNYVLELSEGKAQEMGISSTDYQRIKKDVAETNSALQEVNLINDSPVTLINPQDFDLNFARVDVITRSESRPDGNGFLNNDQYVTISIYVPRGCSYINMNMYSKSVIGVGSATLYYGGSPYSCGSCMSSGLTGAGSFNLNVPMSGMSYNVALRVSSSLGGSYYYYVR